MKMASAASKKGRFILLSVFCQIKLPSVVMASYQMTWLLEHCCRISRLRTLPRNTALLHKIGISSAMHFLEAIATVMAALDAQVLPKLFEGCYT